MGFRISAACDGDGFGNAAEAQPTALSSQAFDLQISRRPAGLVSEKVQKNDDVENTPNSVDVKNNNNIRTHPPTPQCFSAGKGLSKAASPKPFRTRPLVSCLSEFKNLEKLELGFNNLTSLERAHVSIYRCSVQDSQFLVNPTAESIFGETHDLVAKTIQEQGKI
ncbi:hypothetical protein CASFOL_001711 [Castilleja foliolosa]|uniref:Uncharacterized protein n=1 Tax=Castilleja foliolosa TaxID=1961234 RepID=A0ABD3EFW7_9LAMI